jgi:methionyl-tRNA formyltransferase
MMVAAESTDFDICAVVTQPPARSGKGMKLTPSPVHLVAESHDLPVWIPQSAKDPAFLQQLQDLQPDLCITAAYGNFLPQKFLQIPEFGTLNIHPSLLPAYRGAAPVQRSLEAGEPYWAVSLLFTTLKMDAGPILKQWSCPDDDASSSNEVQHALFEQGTKLLLDAMPALWAAGSGREEQRDSKGVVTKMSRAAQYIKQHHATPQDASCATHAPKLSKKEGDLSLEGQTPHYFSATTIHNKVRAFTDIGVWVKVQLVPQEKNGEELVLQKIVEDIDGGASGDANKKKGKNGKKKGTKVQRLRLVRTRRVQEGYISSSTGNAGNAGNAGYLDGLQQQQLHLSSCGTSLLMTCGGGGGQRETLEVQEVQVQGKAATSAKGYWNGIQGRRVYWLENDQQIQVQQ